MAKLNLAFLAIFSEFDFLCRFGTFEDDFDKFLDFWALADFQTLFLDTE